MYMMLMPRSDFDLFDDFFGDSFFSPTVRNVRTEKLMKTDIVEKDKNYEVLVDLPGYDKNNIEVNVENGYLNIHAKIEKSNDEKDKDKDKFVRRERFYGECSRSFYIGEDVKQEDIKASFKNGTLTVVVPKIDETKKLPAKKTIEIE